MPSAFGNPSLKLLARNLSKAGPAFWIFSLATAAAEGSIGWWLRHLPLGGRAATSVLASWLGLLFALLALRVASSWGRDQAQEAAGIRAGDRLVRRVWSFDGAGEETAWLTREGRDAIEQGARSALVLASSALSLVVLVPLMVWLSPLLSCALLVLAPLLGWIGKLRWRATRDWIAAEQSILSRHALDESWAWRASPEASASGSGALLSRLRRAASIELARARLRGSRIVTRGQASTEAVAHAAGWILASLALLGWSRGLLSAPDLLAFLAAALLAYRPIREAGRALPAWHRHQSVLERAATLAKATRNDAIPEARALSVRNLRVAAPDGAILVDGPTFELRPGEVFLLSGANGSGKTSLLAGLLGWRNATGVLARPARIRALAQEPVLPPFSPSRWSGTESPASLPLFPLLFPNGLPCDWDEPLREGGTRLSRGERARIALLCLTATPADLWFFDEPFSALPIAERGALLAALRSIQGDAALLFSDPLVLDPADAPVVWEASPGRKGPRIYRL